MGPAKPIAYKLDGCDEFKIEFKSAQTKNNEAILDLFKQVGDFELLKEIWEDDTNPSLFKVFSELREKYCDDFPAELEEADQFFEDKVDETYQQLVIDAWIKDMEKDEVEGSLGLYAGKTEADWVLAKQEGSI